MKGLSISGRNFRYLEGLNSLRFFAAFLVIVYHAAGSLIKLGLLDSEPIPIFNKGTDAVDFFFTLSGFLITYLLLQEDHENGSISIKKFYMRRMLRIWPVYFLIVLFRFLLYGIAYSYFLHVTNPDFPIFKGLLLYIFFLPNLAAILYDVGLLHPLWSIGVEEQFYLLWAPLFKSFKRRIGLLIAAAIPIWISWYLLTWYNVFNFNPVVRQFLLTERFFAMIIGAGFGCLLFYRFENYDRSFFASRYFQVFVLLCLIYHFVLSDRFENSLWFSMVAPFLYGAFILNVACIRNKLFSLEKRPLVFLGTISYGLYMYHEIIDFFLRRTFQRLMQHNFNHLMLIALYFILMIGGSILLAYISYNFFEARFLRIKHKYSTVR